jgi:hypothetical protein
MEAVGSHAVPDAGLLLFLAPLAFQAFWLLVAAPSSSPALRCSA